MRKKVTTLFIGILFLGHTGIMFEPEFGYFSYFLKYRPTSKMVFYSPSQEKGVDDLNLLSFSELREDLFYNEFVGQYRMIEPKQRNIAYLFLQIGIACFLIGVIEIIFFNQPFIGFFNLIFSIVLVLLNSFVFEFIDIVFMHNIFKLLLFLNFILLITVIYAKRIYS